MANAPIYAKQETHLMRCIKRFHEQLIVRLGKDNVDTMRRAAWQIEEYLEEEHGKYADAEFIRTIQKSLEKIIQMRTKSDWTVQQSKTSLKGRTTGVNQFADKNKKPRARPLVSKKLSQEITDKVLEAPRQQKRRAPVTQP